MKRAPEEPAFVLHRYDWSESSLILEMFTRRHGRVALAAKGAKRPHSSLRPVLLPMQPLHVSFGGETEVRTLKTAEWIGGQAMPSGQALLTGYYVNELVLRMLAREDPHETLFDGYAELIALIGAEGVAATQAALRAFELLLLKETGHLPALDVQISTGGPLLAATTYRLINNIDYPGAKYVSGQTIYKYTANLTVRRDAAYRSNDEFNKLYHWYSVGFQLGTERYGQSKCILLARSSQWFWRIEHSMSVMLCDAPSDRMIFVMRSFTLRYPAWLRALLPP